MAKVKGDASGVFFSPMKVPGIVLAKILGYWAKKMINYNSVQVSAELVELDAEIATALQLMAQPHRNDASANEAAPADDQASNQRKAEAGGRTCNGALWRLTEDSVQLPTSPVPCLG